MTISVYGAGYVGLVSATCLASLGFDVTCVDINENRLQALLRGEMPIHEEQLTQLLQDQVTRGFLRFTDSLALAIQHATIHLITVGTPGLPDGGADVSGVFSVATQIALESNRDCVIVIKSTVPVGTGDALDKHIKEALRRHGQSHRVDVVSNPEFLREGHAVNDFLHPDRIVLGGETQALMPIRALYQSLDDQGVPIQCMSRVSAELTKYAANAMLACKISFMNQISQIAEKVGANIDDVKEGICLDHRIGPHFLQAGIGYGGSCFPKDVRALIHTAKTLGVDGSLFEAIDSVNCVQKSWVMEQLATHFKGDLQNLTIGIWGLAFKPGTDDVREASSLSVVASLLEVGVNLSVYDPAAMPNAQKFIGVGHAITWCDSADDVLTSGIDALVIATEWPVFKNYSLAALQKALGNAPIVDGRNCFDLSRVRAPGLPYYYSVGRPRVLMEDTGLTREEAAILGER